MNVVVRRERTDDVAAIRRVHDAAFGGPLEGRIVDQLRGTDDWYPDGSLVAEDPAEAAIAGHLLLSRGRVVVADGSQRAIGIIGPVGVLPEHQGQGIGAALMWQGMEVARELGLPAVCLLGHADYYPRFGFRPARALGLAPPSPWPDANWMAVLLPGWDRAMRGRVVFPPAFPTE